MLSFVSIFSVNHFGDINIYSTKIGVRKNDTPIIDIDSQ
ncbi:MAG: hypothetical protein [Bacteriophage sp.]|nr:MAG: hypothetical protein [Bacteriophage sp.]